MLVANSQVFPVGAAEGEFDDSDPTDLCADEIPAQLGADIAVTSMPMTVVSDEGHYFVLYRRFQSSNDAFELPVKVIPGQDGHTTISSSTPEVELSEYRLMRYDSSRPGDVDGDCIDDFTELMNPIAMNPVNPTGMIPLKDGASAIPDRASYDRLSHRGYVKFVLKGINSTKPALYFINTSRHSYHPQFMKAVGLHPSEVIRGNVSFDPDRLNPAGELGSYQLSIDSLVSIDGYLRAGALVAASMPFVNSGLQTYIAPNIRRESGLGLAELEAQGLNIVTETPIAATFFEAMNSNMGFGILRRLDLTERPGPLDIVIYDALPNDLPPVAGVITTVPQTPLAHVNLRAIQNGIPNAYIRDALTDDAVRDLLGEYVRYEVRPSGWDVRAATIAEVEAHVTSSRPQKLQRPSLRLDVDHIAPLSEVGFEDADAFGAKAANVAVLGKLGLPDGTAPIGFAVPLSFYVRFMDETGLDERVDQMLTDPEFSSDYDTREEMLEELRDAIIDAPAPDWVFDALADVHAAFPPNTSLRYRSSTNSEDLPGFSGAGLYDSKTQHPHEQPLTKSLQQVYASLWNFRAFAEREFHQIDHAAVAMGVLIHPNYQDELVNGVAVSWDPVGMRDDGYYVNMQVGEDLVTNPESSSLPEELILERDSDQTTTLRYSSLQASRVSLLADKHQRHLRDWLQRIHDRFADLYDADVTASFAIEVEFKITSDDRLIIKQARPWVFSSGHGLATPEPDIADDDPSASALLKRLAGADRYQTSLAVATEYVQRSGKPPTRAVLASGVIWTDAAVAAGLAGRLEAPLLLFPPTGPDAETLDALASWGVSELIAVTSSVEFPAGAARRAGFSVRNIYGADPFETAAAVADAIGDTAPIPGLGRTVILTGSRSFADSLAGAPIAAYAGIPMLLTTTDSLHPAALAWLTSSRAEHVLLIGGIRALSPQVEAAIEDLGINTTRIAGEARGPTAVLAAGTMAKLTAADDSCPARQSVGLTASDITFADALGASALLGSLCAPLLLTPPDALAPSTRSKLRAMLWESDLEVLVFGGLYAVSTNAAGRAAVPW